MKKTGHETYRCNICGREFEMRRVAKNHESGCGISTLDRFDDSGEFRKLHGIGVAQRKNNYDKNNNSESKGRQVNLRNQKLSSKSRKNKNR